LAVVATGHKLCDIFLNAVPPVACFSECSKQRDCARVGQSAAVERLDDVILRGRQPPRWGHWLWLQVGYGASIVLTFGLPVEGWSRLSRMSMATPLARWGLTSAVGKDYGRWRWSNSARDRHDTAIGVVVRVRRGRRRRGELGG